MLNCGDPQAPTTTEICQAIAEALQHELEIVPIPEATFERPDLGNPWAVPRPVVLDMSRAELDLGYRPVTTYAAAVEETCTWLAGTARERDRSDTYLEAFFDYAAEDALLATRR